MYFTFYLHIFPVRNDSYINPEAVDTLNEHILCFLVVKIKSEIQFNMVTQRVVMPLRAHAQAILSVLFHKAETT